MAERDFTAGRLSAPAFAYVLLLTACIPAIKTPEVRLHSVNPKSAGEAVVELEIVNPNRFALRVVSADYKVLIGKRLCGKGRRSDVLSLAAGGTTLADFPLAIDYSELLKSVPALFTDTVVFSVKGRYVVSTPVGRRRFGFGGEERVAAGDVVRSFVKGWLKE
jgi:LEA14-like dessication related protein